MRIVKSGGDPGGEQRGGALFLGQKDSRVDFIFSLSALVVPPFSLFVFRFPLDQRTRAVEEKESESGGLSFSLSLFLFLL